MLSNNAYDIINKIQRWLCAVGVLYLALSAIWGLPFGDQINQSIVAVSAFLATFLEIATSKWNKENSISITNFKELADQLGEENEDAEE